MKKHYKLIFFTLLGKIGLNSRFSSKKLAIQFAKIVISVYHVAYGYKILRWQNEN